MTQETENAIIDKLNDTNPDFRRLFEEHQNLDTKVTELVNKHSASASDELEIKRLKKLKLAKKDMLRKMISAAEKG